MDKWQNQFDKLKRQWSEYNWMDSDYKPHDKRQIAKIGVAWVVKLPGEYFRKPVGWEVEIIDTPIGISERTNNLLRWLKHPPTNIYDNISLFNDSSRIILNESFNRHDFGYKRSYERAFPPSQQRFTIPPNEYEIFKKTCCECKEKSFKNSTTDYESDIRALPPQEHVPFRLSVKHSYLDLPPESIGSPRTHRKSSPSEYSEFEQEINNQILDAMTQSSIDRSKETNHSSRLSPSRNHKKRNSKSKTSNLTNQGVETSNVLSDLQPYKEPSLMSEYRYSVKNEIMDEEHSPTHNHHGIGHSSVTENTNNQSPRRRSTGPHIPSINAFDDHIMSRGTSLEQYRNIPPNMQGTIEETSEHRRPSMNGHRNHHRHRHRRNGSKEVSIDATINDNYASSEFNQNDVIE